MKTVASLTAALIASVAVAGFTAPAAAAFGAPVLPDVGNFVCTVKTAEGPSQNLLKVDTKFEVLVTKTEVLFSNDFRLPHKITADEYKHDSGSWSRSATYHNDSLSFLFGQRYFVPSSNPSAGEMSYSFLLSREDNLKVNRWGECRKIFK